MHLSRILLATAGFSFLVSPALVASNKPAPRPEFKTRVVAQGLNAPTGIVAGGDGEIYFTEVPTPGIAGGSNGVKVLHLCTGEVDVVNMGEPDPVNITMDVDGSLYWTCRSAGVILKLAEGGTPMPLLTGLESPTGIAADDFGNIFYTEVPTPGVGGGSGGMNTVNVDHGDIQRMLNVGDPEPTDIAVGFGGTVYWTCTSAGVIVSRDRLGNVAVLLSGLDKPTGIALDRYRDRLYWTEVPTPGISGANGGTNKVWEYNLRNGKKTLVNAGDPAPTDITVAMDGSIYWTCTSAGVIVEARRSRGRR